MQKFSAKHALLIGLSASLVLSTAVIAQTQAPAANQPSANQTQQPPSRTRAPEQTPGAAPAQNPAPSGLGGVETAPPPVQGPASPGRSPAAGVRPSTIAPAPSTEALRPKHVAWSFNGPFGTFDRGALQRGFQVYKEVCSACHSMERVAFRNLADRGGPGFTEAQVLAIAAGTKVSAGPDEMGRTVDANGQPLTRPGTAADYFPSPFANENAARMANNGALPPDLSLIVKARSGHEDYVYSILTGFGQQPPPNERMPAGLYYNPYFPRHLIAMPPPLTNGSVTFADGTPNTVDQEARDVVTFLAWAAEPKMEERKRMGFNVVLFLIAFGTLTFFSYRRIWHGHHDVGATGEGLE